MWLPAVVPKSASGPLVHYVVGEILVWHTSPKPVSRELTPAGTSAHRRLFAHVDGLTGCQHLDKAGKQPARALPSTSRVHGSGGQSGEQRLACFDFLDGTQLLPINDK